MDKRWKNLVIVAICLLILVVIYFFLFSGWSLIISEKSLEEGYEIIDSYFLKNNIDREQFQTLSILNLSPDGKVIWVVEKEKILSLRNDLVSFKNMKGSFADNNYAELSDYVELYIKGIDYLILTENDLNKISEIVLYFNSDCSNKDVLPQISEVLLDNYLDYYDLDMNTVEFSEKYNLISPPFILDSVKLYEDYALMESAWDQAYTQCEVN